jgi:hypothetical protein
MKPSKRTTRGDEGWISCASIDVSFAHAHDGAVKCAIVLSLVVSFATASGHWSSTPPSFTSSESALRDSASRAKLEHGTERNAQALQAAGARAATFVFLAFSGLPAKNPVRTPIAASVSTGVGAQDHGLVTFAHRRVIVSPARAGPASERRQN